MCSFSMDNKTPRKTKLRSEGDSVIGSVTSEYAFGSNKGKRQGVSSESVSEILEFYASIPDYGEVHHLSDIEFNQRLQTLREKCRAYLQDYSLNRSKINSLTSIRDSGEIKLKKQSIPCKRTNDFGLAGKKCAIYSKHSRPFLRIPHEIKKCSRSSFYDIDFDDRFIPSPDTYSVTSSEVLNQSKQIRAKREAKGDARPKSACEKIETPIRVESNSSVVVSDKSATDFCGKFECLSDSDSWSPVPNSQSHSSKLWKNESNNDTPQLVTLSRNSKSYMTELDESKLSNDTKNENKPKVGQSVPDLRVSSPTFNPIVGGKNIVVPSGCQKNIMDGIQRKKSMKTTISNSQEGWDSKGIDNDCLNSVKQEKYCKGPAGKPRYKHGICFKNGPFSVGCPSSCGVVSISSPDTITSTSLARSYPQSVVIPSKNNLAAILRIQSTRRKMERDLEKKLIELKRKEDACIKAHLARQQPAWQAILYTAEEDIALRRLLRKEKEMKHRREHQHQMSLMLARVQQIPPLFERQIQVSH